MSLTKAQAKIKKTWLKALRSGKYKQGDGVLYRPDTKQFCCLGVLEHCLLDGKVENVCAGSSEFAAFPSLKFYETFDLEWLRMNEARLASYNDSGTIDTDFEPLKFEQIADHIEKKWV